MPAAASGGVHARQARCLLPAGPLPAARLLAAAAASSRLFCSAILWLHPGLLAGWLAAGWLAEFPPSPRPAGPDLSDPRNPKPSADKRERNTWQLCACAGAASLPACLHGGMKIDFRGRRLSERDKGGQGERGRGEERKETGDRGKEKVKKRSVVSQGYPEPCNQSTDSDKLLAGYAKPGIAVGRWPSVLQFLWSRPKMCFSSNYVGRGTYLYPVVLPDTDLLGTR